jgi:hypothetical protein
MRSSDRGDTWTVSSTPLSATTDVSAIARSGEFFFLSGRNGVGVFRSTDNGWNWEAVLPGLEADAFASNSTYFFAGTSAGIYRTSDNGMSWTWAGAGLPTSSSIDAIAVSGSYVFAGGSAGVYGSTNNGTSWTVSGLTDTVSGLSNLGVNALVVLGTTLFAGTPSGVFVSTNNGTNWRVTGLKYGYVRALAANGTDLFAGTGYSHYGRDGTGVFYSSDNGSSWSTVGLTNLDVSCLAVNGTELFAGTNGQGVWRRPLSQMVTSVELSSSTPPGEFRLEQNFPNPFNPSTTIRFSIPHAARVLLRVFDVLGREIAVLINEELAGGIHLVPFEGRALSSGVYYYRFQAGEYTDTKKLLLLR